MDQVANANQIKAAQNIRDIIPDKIISKIHAYVSKNNDTNQLTLETMIEEIEVYFDTNSSRWIYGPIVKNTPESRYPILLIHYLDRNPRDKDFLNQLLPGSTLTSIESIKKSFKLGC